MGSPFTYREVGELMGSWPFSVLKDPSAVQQLQPNSLSVKASLISTRRATAVGYNVGGLSLTIYVDVGGTPTAHTVTFPAGAGLGTGGVDYYTLAQVIARFQASTPALPANTAQNSDNYLLLQSQTSGELSYVRLESILGAEGAFRELGLQPGITVRGGELKAAQHIDPTRQSAGVNQLAMQHGESFSADVVNRLALQLAYNAAQARGTTDLRRMAVRTEEAFVGSGLAGVQLSAGDPDRLVYTGSVLNPSTDDLRKYIVVLDSSGNEFIKEMESAGTNFTNLAFTFDAATNEQRVTSASITFLSTDPDGNWYVVATNLTGGGVPLNNKPLKIIRFIGANTVVVDSVDPATGNRLQITEASKTGRRSQIFAVKCEVEGFYSDSGFTTAIEQTQVAVTGGAVTEIEGPNRIFVSAATFSTITKPGDLVVWTSSANTSPYSNDGTYRISRVLDNRRIELVDENYNPVILNPSIGFGLGTIAVKTDGDFFRQPYVKFMPANLTNFGNGTGALPNGENFRIVYLEGKPLRTALDLNPAALAPDLRTEIDGTGQLQNAILRLVGPSVSRYEEVLYGKEMLSIDFLNREHNRSGRHSNIHPDKLDMYPNVTGGTVNFRGHTVNDAQSVAKVTLTDDQDSSLKLGVNSKGQINIGDVMAIAQWDELDVTGADNYGDVVVNRTSAAYGLFRGSRALSALSGGSPSSPLNTDAVGVASQRFYFRGTTPHIYSNSLKAVDTATQSFLSLGDIKNDGGGLSFLNNLIVYSNGNVGVGFASDILTTPVTFKPAVPLHVTARDNTISELIRLEGFGAAGDPTVAISMKPRRDLGLFGFIELDHTNPSGVGDWNMNFVLTQAAEADSDAVGTSRAYFRWVASASNVLKELMRLDPVTGLTFDFGSPGIFFKSGASGVFTHDGTGAVNFKSSGTLTFASTLGQIFVDRFISLRGGIDLLGILTANNAPIIDWGGTNLTTGTEDHFLERLGTNSGSAPVAFRRFASEGVVLQTRGVDHNFSGRWSASANIFTVTPDGTSGTPLVLEWTNSGLNFYSKPAAAPATFGKANMALDIQILKRNPAHTDNAGARMLMRNGILQFNNAVNGEQNGSNPNRNQAPLPNALYGANIVKQWAVLELPGSGVVNIANRAGFNIATASVNGSGRLVINNLIDVGSIQFLGEPFGLCIPGVTGLTVPSGCKVGHANVFAQSQSQTELEIYAADAPNTPLDLNSASVAVFLSIVWLGLQT